MDAGGVAPVKVLFCGSYPWSLFFLEALWNAPTTRLAAVVTRPVPVGPAGSPAHVNPVAQWHGAQDRHCPLLTFATLRNEAASAALGAVEADLILSAAYPCLIPASLVAARRLGGCNVHPSALPRLRGADPVRWAILEQHERIGCTMHLLAEAVDAGDILWQETIPLPADATCGEILHRLGQDAAQALPDVLDRYARGLLIPQPQRGQPTFAPALTEEQRTLPGSYDVSGALRLARALAPFRYPLFKMPDGACVELLTLRQDSGPAPSGLPIALRDGLLYATAYRPAQS